jgi:glucose/arabinose dehydrogenase
MMRLLLVVIIVSLLIVAGAIHYFYPTLYGIIPDKSAGVPKLNLLPSPASTGGDKNGIPDADIPAETIVAEGLDTPWAIAFLPTGDMLVTERKGTVRLVTKNGQLGEDPVSTIGSVKEIGEGGLLGIALHPDFEKNNYVYLYYTFSAEGDSTKNRVVRMKYDNGKLINEEIILDKIPGASNHNGGRIKFGPDNFLYITTGDAQEPSQAQDKNSLAGKILRVTPEGKPAPGNPFNNEVYSYGHRNPQGIGWGKSGTMYETEHGPSGGSLGTGNDEVNVIRPGDNYGWPVIQGDQTKEGMITPSNNSTPSVAWAPGGIAVIDNKLYFGGLRGQALYEQYPEDEYLIFKEHLKGKYGRIREVILGPDNMLYITTSNRDGRGIPNKTDDRIIRINPTKL